MIDWLVDNVNIVYVLLALAFLCVCVLFWQTKRARELAVLGGILGFGVLVWYLSSLIMTDRKQVEANMHALADSCLNNQPEKMAAFLADRKYGGRTRLQVAQDVTQLARQHGITNYRMSDFEVKILSRDKDRGRAQATFMMRIDASSDRLAVLRCWATFVFEGGRWCLESFAYSVNPLSSDEKRPAPQYAPDS